MSENVEEWRDAVGYEGFYRVSSHGRVKSSPRKGTPGVIRKATPHVRTGHLVVSLSVHQAQTSEYVHTLVMSAFVGPRPEGMVTRHLDGNSQNPMLSNLAYGTPAENMADAVKHGTHFQVAKDSCPNGHPYSGENLYQGGSDDRQNRRCKECRKQLSAAEYAARSPERKREIYERRNAQRRAQRAAARAAV